MRILTLLIDELQEGMQVATNIYNDQYVLLIKQGTILNRVMINKLRELNINLVKVCDGNNGQLHNVYNNYGYEDKQFIETYEKTLLEIRDIVKRLKFEKTIDVEKVKIAATDLLQEVLKNNNIQRKLKVVKGKDEYTYTHSINVAIISSIIGKWLGLDTSDIYNLSCAGLLHDIGKSITDERILNKPGELTEEEFKIIKNHTIEGFKLLGEVSDLHGGIIMSAISHHEKCDGSGYPLGLIRNEIHLYARIIAVADIYDAMTSDRIYRKKVSPFKVAEQIATDQFGCLDPNITQVFLKNISMFYIGNKVELSNGMIGEIVYINPHYPTRPVVAYQNQYINLLNSKLEIIDVLA